MIGTSESPELKTKAAETGRVLPWAADYFWTPEMDTEIINGYYAQQQFLFILNRIRCPRRRGLCPFETGGRPPNSGR
eukprot:404786-Pyramimonas_sp.AAC.1